jgi:hypothetical protein
MTLLKSRFFSSNESSSFTTLSFASFMLLHPTPVSNLTPSCKFRALAEKAVAFFNVVLFFEDFEKRAELDVDKRDSTLSWP